MASKAVPTLLSALARPSRSVIRQSRTPLSHRLLLQRPSICLRPAFRFAHSIPRPQSSRQPSDSSKGFDPSEEFEPSSASPEHSRPTPKAQQPHYELTFTCVPCGHRSAHKVSKQGYHHGSVLITCPSCRNRHIISDHLNIFGNRKITVEDLMREKGRLVKKGTLGEDGDIEFWEDGTTTVREERQETDPVPQASGAVDDGAAPGSSWSSTGDKSS